MENDVKEKYACAARFPSLAWMGCFHRAGAQCFLFVGTHLVGSNHQSLAVWVLGSWPTLMALAAGLFLLEAGPLRSWPVPLRKVATLLRYVLCFLACWAVLPLLGLPKNVMTPIALLGTGAFFFLTLFQLGKAFRNPRLLGRGFWE